MSTKAKSDFVLDHRLAWDSEHLLWLDLCELRLVNDRRWPWLVLVPQRPNLEEVFDLEPLDQAVLTFETNLVASMLKEFADCDKINIGALGNVVRQLHVHVVARQENDMNWPGPVWGHGEPERYEADALADLVERIRSAF